MEHMTLTKPRAVIFDWDNTLVNTWPIIHAALAKTFRNMGRREWTMEETQARVRKSMRDSFPEVFGEGWQKAGELYQGYYRAIHLQMLEALPGAEDVLKRVRELKLYSTVVSNKKGNNLRLEIDTLGWRHYFDAIVGADDAVRDKPHTDPVHLAFEKAHLKPGPDVWFIGDSEIDLECAENSGCTGILFGPIARTHVTYSDTHYHGFPYHVHAEDHKEVLGLLK
jgi:phosphoglycolate phosphatase